jgi:hypothetical protein
MRVDQTLTPALALAEGKMVWHGHDAFWQVRFHDPDRTILSSEQTLPLDAAPEEMVLLLDGEFIHFRPDTNRVTITKYNKRHHRNTLLDVRPHSLWFHVFSPPHFDSFLLFDLIGPDSKAALPGDTLEVSKDGDLIVHKRTRADGPSSTMTFSLTNDGNLVENRTINQPGPNGLAMRATYDWGRAATGECYPKHYRHEQFLAGDQDNIRGYYSLEITSIDLSPRDRTAELTKEAMFARLPENVRVDDQIRKVNYALEPRATLSTRELDQLVPALQASGYLKR